MPDWITPNKGAGVWPFTKSENKLRYNEGSSFSDSPLNGGSPIPDLTYKDFGSTPITPIHDPGCGYWPTAPLEQPPPPSDDDNTDMVCPLLTKSWESRTTSYIGNWISGAFGNGIFVLVGPSQIIKSTDGVVWDQIGSPTDNQHYGVAFGNGLFVAVASGGNDKKHLVITSPDGITWTPRTTNAGLDDQHLWRAITFGEGLFVATAVTGTGDRVMTSPDGINWILRTSALDVSWNAIAYGDGKFVAVSDVGWVMTSGDGIDWTLRSPSALNEWQGICFGNGRFVAVANHGLTDRVMWSEDGISWTSLSSGQLVVNNFLSQWFAIAYGHEKYMAVGIDWPYTMSCVDTVMWEGWIPPVTIPLRCIVYGQVYGSGKYVLAGVNYTGASIMTSSSGEDFEISLSAYNFQATSIAYGEDADRFIAIGGNNNLIHLSSDAIQWQTNDVGAQLYWNKVICGNGLFMVVGATGSPHGLVSTSSGGVSWREKHTSDMGNQILVDVAYGDGIYVIISGASAWGDPIKTFTSSDGGNTWTALPAIINIPWGCIAYGNGVFVALAQNEPIAMVSSNGINWTTHGVPDGFTWSDITYGGQIARFFVAVASDAAPPSVMLSEDGINWSLSSAAGGYAGGRCVWNAITYAETGVRGRLPSCCIFIAIGYGLDAFGVFNGGRCMYSLDGVDWHSVTVPSLVWYSIAYGNDKFVAVGSSATQGVMTLEYPRYQFSLL